MLVRITVTSQACVRVEIKKKVLLMFDQITLRSAQADIFHFRSVCFEAMFVVLLVSPGMVKLMSPGVGWW